MDIFGRKATAAAAAEVQGLKSQVKALQSKVHKSYIPMANLSSGFDINQFKQFLGSGQFHIGERLAYSLYDHAAPLSNSVDKIASAIAALTPMVRTTEGELVAESKTLDVLRNPGFGQTYQQFILDYTISFLLTRNAYTLTDPNKVTIRTSKPFQVEVEKNQRDGYAQTFRVTGTNGSQSSFERKIKNGTWLFIDPVGQELLQLKGQTTDDGLKGRSPIESILVEASQNIEGGRHNLSLLQNGLRTAGAFSADGELSDDQFERLKEQIDEEHQGASNAGNPLLLEGGIKYLEMSKTNKDMDYATILKYSKNEIAQKYNIPLPLVSVDKMTLSNYATGVQAFYDDAVFPAAEMLLNAIGTALDIEEGHVLTFDKDQVPAIRERRLNEAKTRHDIGAFSDNETRETLGIEPYEGGDTIYKPANLLPVGADDGSRDQGEIEEEEKAFIGVCVKQHGMTEEEAKAEWVKLT